MRSKLLRLVLTALVLTVGVRTVRADVIVQWNAIAAQNMTGNIPLPHTREFAILHVAIYDAVVSVTRDHTPYKFHVPAPSGASAEAAAIAAAHAVLLSFHPGNASTLNAQYASSLAAIPNGQGKIDGVSVGEQVAAAVLAARSLDGYDGPAPTVVDGTLPYEWRRTAASPPPLTPHFAIVTPWVIEDPAQFLPKPPPELTSRRYTRDFNEVKDVGSANSTVPQDRREVALFHVLSHPQFWNAVARQLLVERPLGLSRTARFYALLNTAIMDAYIGAWHAKWYVYYNWRPVTAIQLADTDSNPHSDADPTWTPLAPTPMHPTYPSGHAVAAGAASYVTKRFFGEAGHDLILISPTTAPGVTLRYSSIHDVVDDIHDARVYLGVHFRFDVEAGHRLGVKTARFAFNHAFRKDSNDDDCLEGDDEDGDSVRR
jgi:hypothetical protein